MDKCADLLPECFAFVRGIVDSPDLSLNISRELLQHDRQLKVIATNIEKRIKSELKKLMDEDHIKFETALRMGFDEEELTQLFAYLDRMKNNLKELFEKRCPFP